MYYLRPKTLQTIKHLAINGTKVDLDRILASPHFTGVTGVTITNPILPEQQEAFRHISCQLTTLSDTGHKDLKRSESSIKYFGEGALQNLHTFYLQNVRLPPLREILANGDGIAINLKSIAFVPFHVQDTAFTDEHIPDGYIIEAIELLRIISNFKFLPALRLVQVGLGRGAKDNKMKSDRIAFLDELWNSAGLHGLWRLATGKRITDQAKPFINGWVCWCDGIKGDLFLTTEEVSGFGTWCKKDKRYPRFEDFCEDNIHITVQADGLGVDKLHRDLLGQIHGVSILPADELNIEETLKAVSRSTRCVFIQFQSLWGTVIGYPNKQNFSKIETLRLQNVGIEDLVKLFDEPRPYCDNLALAVLTRLSLPQWTSLRDLTVPAMALQRGDCEDTIETGPTAASCGSHLPAYSFPWLSSLASLRTFRVIDWLACFECYEELKESENSTNLGNSFPGELKRRIPRGVIMFVLLATFWCPSDEDRWVEILENDFKEAVGGGVNVDMSYLWVQEMGFDDDEDQDDN